ncbi:MAG: ATP-binding protein [bacterium]
MTTTAEPGAGRRARILVVDDEAQTVKAVQYLLRRRYEVLGATRAEEALELMTHTPVDVVLCDQRMPGMTGDQFFTRIAEEYADTVRILITAYADMDALVRSVNRGRIFAYLPKPWRVEDLEQVVEKAIIYRQECEMCRTRLDRLRLINERLERTNEDLRSFSHMVAHDLKEPLRTISAFTEVLDTDYRGTLDGQAQFYLDRIARCSTHLQSLIDDLTQLGEVQHTGPMTEQVVMQDVAAQALALLHARILASGAEVVVKPLPVVLGDAQRLVLLLQNLISNGIKFNDKEVPRVEVDATSGPPGFVTIRVRDNGIGMPMEGRGRIFEAFERMHSRSEFDGTGLGLAIARRVVENHGGRINVDSQPGLGSTFEFTLPIAG